MRTIKALFSALAVGATAVALAATVSAATVNTFLDASAYDAENNTITTVVGTDYQKGTGQMTALVVSADKWDNISESSPLTADDILYINQFDATKPEETIATIGLKGALTSGEEYYVLLGGDEASSVYVMSVTYTEQTTDPDEGEGETPDPGETPDVPDPIEVQLGDVNDDGYITGLDIDEIVLDMKNITKLEGRDFYAADCNEDTYITGLDIDEIVLDMKNITKLTTVIK